MPVVSGVFSPAHQAQFTAARRAQMCLHLFLGRANCWNCCRGRRTNSSTSKRKLLRNDLSQNPRPAHSFAGLQQAAKQYDGAEPLSRCNVLQFCAPASSAEFWWAHPAFSSRPQRSTPGAIPRTVNIDQLFPDICAIVIG